MTLHRPDLVLLGNLSKARIVDTRIRVAEADDVERIEGIDRKPTVCSPIMWKSLNADMSTLK